MLCPLTFPTQCPDDLKVSGYYLIDGLLHTVLLHLLLLSTAGLVAKEHPVHAMGVPEGHAFSQEDAILVLREITARVEILRDVHGGLRGELIRKQENCN